MERSTVERVASVPGGTVSGTFYRHAAPNRDAFAGAPGGRWGRNFPVIYLAQPESSAVIEAYRHLVEDAGVPASAVGPRVLHTVQVHVERIVDLTLHDNLETVGLTQEDLITAVYDYAACQDAAAAAHQLGYHGVLAPAAHGLGQTLALFRERLTPQELPVAKSQTMWQALPPDPRRLRQATARRDEA